MHVVHRDSLGLCIVTASSPATMHKLSRHYASVSRVRQVYTQRALLRSKFAHPMHVNVLCTWACASVRVRARARVRAFERARVCASVRVCVHSAVRACVRARALSKSLFTQHPREGRPSSYAHSTRAAPNMVHFFPPNATHFFTTTITFSSDPPGPPSLFLHLCKYCSYKNLNLS